MPLYFTAALKNLSQRSNTPNAQKGKTSNQHPVYFCLVKTKLLFQLNNINSFYFANELKQFQVIFAKQMSELYYFLFFIR